ncbi:MAG: hypothetical protein O7F16_13590 [Acidobacteria bacterium]|nr:hypothetical protein [Acidobacteriota bacterium]
MNPRDSRTSTRIVGGLFLLALLLCAAPASATVRQPEPYSMEVLVDGIPLPEYVARNTRYIEAREGCEYSIRLTNRTASRIAIALSVDGLNSIDAKTTTARDGSKWILGPYQTITLDGWQTSNSTARRFYFTTEQESYGAWLGKTSNLGVISANVFREKARRPSPVYRPSVNKSERRFGRDRSGEAPRPAARQESERQSGSASSADAPESLLEAREELSDDLAATGIGRQMDHRVRRVRFEGESRPAAVLNIRYEYHDALVRLGVLPQDYAQVEDPLARRERARGFNDSGFAPDPFQPRRR